MVFHEVIRYFRSKSVQTGLAIGLVWYLSYGFSSQDFGSAILIFTSLFVSLALPHYAKLSNWIEEQVAFRTAFVTAGRLARFGAQMTFNLLAFWLLQQDSVGDLTNLGGILGAAALTTFASFGAQAVAQNLYRANIGEPVFNTTTAISVNIIFGSIATWGSPMLSAVYMGLAMGVGGAIFLIGLTSDIRSIRPKKGGIGVFFGTFNPFHNSHLELVKRLLSERGVSRVYIHPTGLAKLYKNALQEGKLSKEQVGGFDVYSITEKADPMVSYLPFGNKFLLPRTRLELIRAVIKDQEQKGLLPRGAVQAIFHEEEYDAGGFGMVLKRIASDNPGSPMHLAHGSDLGGMWIRSICDETTKIYPLSVRRRDGISATAIRKGARNMAPKIIETILEALAQDARFIEVEEMRFENIKGELHGL